MPKKTKKEKIPTTKKEPKKKSAVKKKKVVRKKVAIKNKAESVAEKIISPLPQVIENPKEAEPRAQIDLQTEPKQYKPTYIYKKNKEANRLIWVGVIIVSAVVLFMWLWNTKVMFENVNGSSSAESELWDTNKQTLAEIYDSIIVEGEENIKSEVVSIQDQIAKQEETKETIKQTLSELISIADIETNSTTINSVTTTDENIQE
ncbi:hypothetical protein KJ641_03725 [Patescibacteria group bacterium]|nr:hypothetical protein [Patescibacteria group bacterium]MBU1895949.1 hypothetical protein [Patescibacteria group bacterium]